VVSANDWNPSWSHLPGPWLFRIIDDPDSGKCVEGFCKATWNKPKTVASGTELNYRE
jgi:hypothetical protein